MLLVQALEWIKYGERRVWPEDRVMNAYCQTTEGKVTRKASWEELAAKVGEL